MLFCQISSPLLILEYANLKTLILTFFPEFFLKYEEKLIPSEMKKCHNHYC